MDSTTKQTTSPDSAQEINMQTTKESTIPTAAPKQPPKISKRDTLLRIKRQLALENELSSAADESENLGIEQVSLRHFKRCLIESYQIRNSHFCFYRKGLRS